MTSEASQFSRVKYIFFDLDDTLCGYWDACKRGLRETFDAHPVDGFTTDQMIRIWAESFKQFAPTLKKTDWYPIYLKTGGPTRQELMRLVLERAGFNDESRAEQLATTYADRRNFHLKLFPDAIGTLEALIERGYKLGLITNGPADVQRQEIATVGVERFFNPILIEGELGFGKPSSKVYDRSHELTQTPPSQTAMIGNSFAHDIAGAQKAGWKTVWVRRASDVPPSADADAKPEEMPEGAAAPDAIVGDLATLKDLFAAASY